jgi:hypothetical protein
MNRNSKVLISPNSTYMANSTVHLIVYLSSLDFLVGINNIIVELTEEMFVQSM